MKFDEDYGYERQRQRKADYGIHRPQRFERHDPAPHLMFEEQKAELFKPISKLERLFVAACVAAFGWFLYILQGVK